MGRVKGLRAVRQDREWRVLLFGTANVGEKRELGLDWQAGPSQDTERVAKRSVLFFFWETTEGF